MSKKERVILQSSKTKSVYVAGVFLFFAVSLAVLFGGNLFKEVFLLTAIGWVVAGCFTVAAFICARRGNGCYILTKYRIIYEEPRGKECWDLQLADIEDCRQKGSFYSQFFKCYKLSLNSQRKKGESKIRSIGPFSLHVANQWEKELKRQMVERNQMGV